MSEYEDSEDLPRHKRREPPPFTVGEQVWFTAPSTGRTIQAEFRGWDGDMAVVRTDGLGFVRCHLTSLRKMT